MIYVRSMGWKLSPGKLAVAAVIVALGGLTALNWQSLLFASAVAASDKRPALLDDAEWGKRETARAFQHRFHAGVPETDLLNWLRDNGFTVDPSAHTAELSVGGVPCAQHAKDSWETNSGKLSSSDAVMTEAGCL